jgi:serine O-acetyltransferase
LSLFKEIKNDFLVVYKKDPAINSKVELIFNYPGVWAIVFYRVSNSIYKKGFKRLARFIMAFNQFLTNIDIHPACTIGKNVFIDHGIGVVIGETAIVEDDVTIYQGVTLGGVSLNKGKRHPTIKKNVIIGAGAKVLGDITIGEGSKIGSNSVVIKNAPPHSTIVGIPGKIINRKDETPLDHNKLPDIDKELFAYLLHRIEILEDSIISGKKDIISKDIELNKKYKEYLNSINND